MITPILEKLLLNGHAKNRIHHVSYGSFAKLEIPEYSFIVIHKIYWNGWMNQKNDKIYSNMSWKQFFQDTEYSLKVQSDKEPPFYYQMRNEVNFQFFNAPGSLKLLNATIQDAQYDDYILMTPKKPVIFDTWITAYTFLNFTITRNALKATSQNFLPVNNYAEEKDVPFGVNNQDVLLDVTLSGTNGTSETYNPPGVKSTYPPIPGTPGNFNTDNYTQLYDKEANPDYGSFLAPPLGSQRLKYSEVVTNPLISFEYCVVSKHAEGNLSSL